jgi:hypothetical protein
MQVENKQMYQELEFARQDLEIAETRTDEVKQLYEKELMGSTQQLEMIEKENEEIRAESKHREQKIYQLEQQLRQSENNFTKSQQALLEYREVAESAIEELQVLRQMLESQAALLTMYQERDYAKNTEQSNEMNER